MKIGVVNKRTENCILLSNFRKNYEVQKKDQRAFVISIGVKIDFTMFQKFFVFGQM